MSTPTPRFYNTTSEDLTHLDSACSGGQPLVTLSDAMLSAGFCPRCAPGWRLITTPNVDDPDFVDISIEVDGVATSLLVADEGYTEAYYAALDLEVEATVAAATDRYVKPMVEWRKPPARTVPGDWTSHQAYCPDLACRPDVCDHLWPRSDGLDGYAGNADVVPEYTCQL